jgi:hypothetical protein
LFGSFSTSQAQPECTAFPLRAQIDIEEWATYALSGNPLGNQWIGFCVRRKFELEAIGQFPHVRL